MIFRELLSETGTVFRSFNLLVDFIFTSLWDNRDVVKKLIIFPTSS
jgi:hypothetical protein